MTETIFKKVLFNKTNSSLQYASEEHILDYITIISAESQLPIKQMLSYIKNGLVDSISCSRDDTNYSFFATKNRRKISIIIKKLGSETIEFDISKNSYELVDISK